MVFHSYGFVLGVGVVLSWWLGEKLLRANHQDERVLGELIWWMLIPGLVGARLYHVLDKWSYYRVDLKRVWELSNGGLGIWGGIVGGLLGVWMFVWLKNRHLEVKVEEEFFMLADVLVLVGSLAQAVGRLGNYVNHELVNIWMYESVLDMILFVVLWVVYRRKGVRGSTLGSYLVGYGLIRVVMEPFRVESWQIAGTAVAQVFGVVAMILGVLILLRRSRKVWQ